jgi:hypothetical protein
VRSENLLNRNATLNTLVTRVMARTRDVGGARDWTTESSAAPNVTIVVAPRSPNADDESRLADVGTRTAPEPVVGTRLVYRAAVDLKPMEVKLMPDSENNRENDNRQ